MSCFATLKKKGLRITRPRRVILDYIHDKGDYLTAEEIIGYVNDKYPGINKSTIYRTLELLEKNECVFKSDSGDHVIYHHAEEGHNHHLVCRRCGKTIDCAEDIFASVGKVLLEKYRFRMGFRHLVISGLCESCRKTAE